MGKKKLIFLIPAVVLVLFAIIYIVVSGNFFNRGESAEKADSSEMIIEEVNAKSSKASENIKKETDDTEKSEDEEEKSEEEEGKSEEEEEKSEDKEEKSKDEENKGKIEDTEKIEEKKETSDSTKKTETSKGKSETDKDGKTGKDTLLIYMIGSDLESRSGAGTDDMEELINSGIDLDEVNVVVYAGGSTKWHNDVVSESKTNILELRKNGFEIVAQDDMASMGTASSVSEFLSYAYANYPSDSFALIMWDHGNGPNIGYGKDMLFGNDSLTLAEMKAALSKSPFGPSNKLAWVGFDACLMSSAELLCIWDDYANYLVASQEIEPSFGWNYDVFGSYGDNHGKKFLSLLATQYLDSCEEYYEKRGYKGKDITIACMDLSYSSELENNINALFSRAASDIDTDYDILVKQRVKSRSLGRASTGSEYDLVDLRDMADKMGEIYPEEAKKLIGTIDKMVVKNETNATLCCGVSMYYPFYNKYYYEGGWSESYANLGVFSGYSKYLEKYQNIWLSDEEYKTYEKELIPEKVTDANKGSGIEGTYRLALSPEQNAEYAEAKVYILENYEGEIYHKVISLGNVKNEGGVLYADFNGKAIFAKTDAGQRDIPITETYDTAGDVTRYGVMVTGTAYEKDTTLLKEAETFVVQMALNNKTEELSIISILPYKSPTKANEITETRLEECEWEDWDEYLFPRIEHKYFPGYEKGVIPPMEKWLSLPLYTSMVIKREAGLNFVYEQVSAGKYSLMFEITDTRGNKYCSELLDIGEGEEEDVKADREYPDAEFNWEDKDEIEIYNKSGVSVKILKSFGSGNLPEYALKVVNENDYPVNGEWSSLVLNEICALEQGSFSMNGHSENEITIISKYRNMEAVAISGIIDEIKSIKGTIEITHNNGKTIETEKQVIKVNFSGETAPGVLEKYIGQECKKQVFMGASADEQVLYEDDERKITLKGFYGTQKFSTYAYLVYENLTDEIKIIKLGGMSVNGRTLEIIGGQNNTVPGKSKLCYVVNLSIGNMTKQKIDEIESLNIRFADNIYTGTSPSKYGFCKWLPVKLSESGSVSPDENIEGTVIYDENKIRITVTGAELTENYNKEIIPTWHAVAENGSDKDICINTTEVNDNSEYRLSITDGCIRAGDKIYFDFTYKGSISDSEKMKERKIKIHIMDFEDTSIIYYGENPVTLPEIVPSDSALHINLQSDTKVKIAEVEEATLYLKTGINYSGKKAYYLELESRTDKSVSANFKINYINGNIAVDESAYVSAYRVGTDQSEIRAGIEEMFALSLIEELNSMRGTVSLIVDNREKSFPVEISFSESGKIDFASSGYEKAKIEPLLDALAEKQVLYESDKVRLTLLSFGKNAADNTNAYIMTENFSDMEQGIILRAISVDGVTLPLHKTLNINSGKVKLEKVRLSDLIKESGISSISDVKVHFYIWDGFNSNADTVMEEITAEVNLKKAGEKKLFVPGNDVVFDKNGVKIIVDEFKYELGSYSLDFMSGDKEIPTWYVTIINDTDEDINLSHTENSKMLFDGVRLNVTHIIAHERVKCKIAPKKPISEKELGFYVRWSEWRGNNCIFADEEKTILKIAEEELGLNPYLDAMAESQVLYENEDICLRLEFFGENNRFDEKFYFSLENKGNKDAYISIENCAVNGITVRSYTTLKAKPRSTTYEKGNLLGTELLKEKGITTIEKLDILVNVNSSEYIIGEVLDSKWTSVKLERAGKAEKCIHGDNVIFDKKGVKIILEGFDYLDDGRASWNVTVINENSVAVDLRHPEGTVLGYMSISNKDMVWMPDCFIGPEQHVHTEIYYNAIHDEGYLDFDLYMRDINGELIYHSDEIIRLFEGDGERFEIIKPEEIQ